MVLKKWGELRAGCISGLSLVFLALTSVFFLNNRNLLEYFFHVDDLENRDLCNEAVKVGMK